MDDTPRRCRLRARASEEDGVTLVEVLVAITLLVTAMMALAQVATVRTALRCGARPTGPPRSVSRPSPSRRRARSSGPN